ncbi:uncharacterized protein LOC111013210 [Momordica charantia]|uniref:Uncharacterized protein LOC111013210 n=1 Tax=Momordica charantia TaxID=3673 RepID=A0A6J1CNG6_MOMCH|nr:uncharacterized protein LOC111013210 [Momordica charantia]
MSKLPITSLFLLVAAMVVLLAGARAAEAAATCDLDNLKPCLLAFTLHVRPSGACCRRVREQESCYYRLKAVLPSTIAQHQSAFVRGRQITDAILVANEVVDLWCCSKKRGIIIKLDLEKAFDKLNWDFLYKVLYQKADKWISSIIGCTSTVSYSILLNGKLRGNISAKRGIRQGDHFPLFSLAMDYLSRILEEAYTKGLIEAEDLPHLARIWDCPIISLLINYLGMPLGGNPKASPFWDPIIERRKLESWKYSDISKAGRLTLIQSILSSLPTYYLSIFKSPIQVTKALEKLMRDFLWKGIGDKRGSHLVRWNIVTLPKSKGSLGITSISITNKALLTSGCGASSMKITAYGFL